MIAKYILIVYMIAGTNHLEMQEFYSLKSCQKNAEYIKTLGSSVREAYCTEK